MDEKMILLAAIAFSWWDLDPMEVRERINSRIMAIEAETPAVNYIKDLVIDKVPVRQYGNTSKNAILMIHGGAWVAGSIETHDNLARYLCKETGLDVISVGYQNAPEGKFPRQLEEALFVLVWMKERYSKVVVVGDSAGGNMAAALCLMVRDRNGPAIATQILINPSLDLRCNGILERLDDSHDNQRWQAIQYVSNLNEVNHPYVSPLIADLSNLPQALIVISEKDEFRIEEEAYAEKLKTAGCQVDLFIHEGAGHLAGHGARASSYAKPSLEAVKNYINHLSLN